MRLGEAVPPAYWGEGVQKKKKKRKGKERVASGAKVGCGLFSRRAECGAKAFMGCTHPVVGRPRRTRARGRARAKTARGQGHVPARRHYGGRACGTLFRPNFCPTHRCALRF